MQRVKEGTFLPAGILNGEKGLEDLLLAFNSPLLKRVRENTDFFDMIVLEGWLRAKPFAPKQPCGKHATAAGGRMGTSCTLSALK